ncbi:MAG: class I SAM-dependent methyltransferase [Bacteroidota bacterium]
MNRLTVINDLVQQKKLDKYLEIGVHDGGIFFRVSSSHKVAVDPKFLFGKFNTWGKVFNFPHNLSNRYFEVTSDEFFEKHAAKAFEAVKPNMIFIDGMHEYHYVLRDVENTLKYMPEGGVIVVHDCSPKTKESAALYDEWKATGFKGLWNGDVWKAMVHLRSMRNDINVMVLDCDHGLGIITKGKAVDMLPFTQQQIEAMTFADLAANREKWLNLKKPEYFYEHFNITNRRARSLRTVIRKVVKGK